MFKCRHLHLSNVDSKGYQYCVECNKAFLVGVKCNHIWAHVSSIEHINVFTSNITKFTYIQRCELCGEFSKFET